MVGESVDYHDRVLFHFLENILKNNASKTEVVNEVDKYFLSHKNDSTHISLILNQSIIDIRTTFSADITVDEYTCYLVFSSRACDVFWWRFLVYLTHCNTCIPVQNFMEYYVSVVLNTSRWSCKLLFTSSEFVLYSLLHVPRDYTELLMI